MGNSASWRGGLMGNSALRGGLVRAGARDRFGETT